jgi:nitroreductase
MKEQNYYQAIFKRKSVRKYDLTPLDDKTLKDISEKIRTLKPMYDNIMTEVKLISDKDVKAFMQIKAPHYIVIFSEPKEGYLTNIGFMFQQMDLFLSANGIGSCWQGMPKPVKEIIHGSKLEFVIVLAFGKPLEPLYRENISEFKRKSTALISNITDADELLEPVRLAPSAVNSQPWFFTGNKNKLHAYCAKLNFLKAFIYEKMNKIDMGIALCHLWLAAQNAGKDVEFISDADANNNPPTGYYYNTTVIMK